MIAQGRRTVKIVNSGWWGSGTDPVGVCLARSTRPNLVEPIRFFYTENNEHISRQLRKKCRTQLLLSIGNTEHSGVDVGGRGGAANLNRRCLIKNFC